MRIDCGSLVISSRNFVGSTEFCIDLGMNDGTSGANVSLGFIVEPEFWLPSHEQNLCLWCLQIEIMFGY